MNILDKIAEILSAKNIPVKKGFLPDSPDALTAVFEYSAEPPEHYFNGTDFKNAVQIRTRDFDSAAAYAAAVKIAAILNRYHDNDISITQATPILDIGRDSHNPQRAEYTVNFKIRRY